MSIDISPTVITEIPAVAAKTFPLSFMTKLLTEASSPSVCRLYAEFTPYRRILDELGNVIGSEFKSPLASTDIITVESPNIFVMTDTDAAGEALVQQTIQTFAMAGGNIGALAFATLLLAVRAQGIADGKFKA